MTEKTSAAALMVTVLLQMQRLSRELLVKRAVTENISIASVHVR